MLFPTALLLTFWFTILLRTLWLTTSSSSSGVPLRARFNPTRRHLRRISFNACQGTLGICTCVMLAAEGARVS